MLIISCCGILAFTCFLLSTSWCCKLATLLLSRSFICWIVKTLTEISGGIRTHKPLEVALVTDVLTTELRSEPTKLTSISYKLDHHN